MPNKSEMNKVKKIAKDLANKTSIKYETALDQTIQKYGYSNWKSYCNGDEKKILVKEPSGKLKDMEQTATISLNELESKYIIDCCNSYIKIYIDLIKNGNKKDIHEVKRALTEEIKDDIIELAKEKAETQSEGRIEYTLTGYKLSQLVNLLCSFCESLEYYTQSVDKESPPELEELNYMTEVGDVFGKILSRVANSINNI